MSNIAIILAGGVGSRMESYNIPKQFIKINNREIILYTLDKFISNSLIDFVVIPCHNEWHDFLQKIINKENYNKKIHLCNGGKSRNDSILNSLIYLNNNSLVKSNDVILTHDSVRMFVSDQIINDNIVESEKGFIVDTCVNACDTIVNSIDSDYINFIPERSEYFLGQTPQSGFFGILWNIYNNQKKHKYFDNTDMCRLAIEDSVKVKIVKGSKNNFKITNDFDLLIANELIKTYKLNVFRLVSPFNIVKNKIEVEKKQSFVLVKPTFLSICNADKRYFFGLRDDNVLKKKLPLSLIHEGIGVVVSSDSKQFTKGENVILLPNINDNECWINENYRNDSKFMSSDCDGFMSDFLYINEKQLIKFDLQNDNLDYLTVYAELFSVCFHAISAITHNVPEDHVFGIWGDGNIGFILHLILLEYYPKNKIIVFGKHNEKLECFDDRVIKVNVTNKLEIYNEKIDIAFEAVGGLNSEKAIKDIIELLNPLGKIFLMGVSENSIGINTRLVLEKGITLIGRSRSTKKDFFNALNFLKNKHIKEKIKKISKEIFYVSNINDMINAFHESQKESKKIILKWEV